MTAEKRTWHKPELSVPVRGKPEEALAPWPVRRELYSLTVDLSVVVETTIFWSDADQGFFAEVPEPAGCMADGAADLGILPAGSAAAESPGHAGGVSPV